MDAKLEARSNRRTTMLAVICDFLNVSPLGLALVTAGVGYQFYVIFRPGGVEGIKDE